MDLNGVLVFVRVIQAGSFSHAARQLGMPISTVSAKVAALERHLGVSLMRRTTRRLHLTESGSAYFQHAVKAVAELQQAEALTSQSQGDIQGRVKITAPVEMGMSSLADVVGEFVKRNPKMRVDLLLTDRLVDLVGDGVDLAIRIGQLKDSSLISKKIGQAGFQAFASPTYLKNAPPLRKPQDLVHHKCLIFSNQNESEWIFNRGNATARGGEDLKVRVQGPFSANNLFAIRRVTLQHLGVALLPSFLCLEDLEKKHLVRVLGNWSFGNHPVHLVYPQQKFLPKNTRAVLDFLTTHLHQVF